MRVKRTGTEEREHRRQIKQAEDECARLYELYSDATERGDAKAARQWFEHWESECARADRMK